MSRYSKPAARTRAFAFAAPAFVALGVLAVAACSAPDKSPRLPLGDNSAATVASAGDASGPKLPLAAIGALDAGNAAYRAKRFPEALAKYHEAAVAAPDHAAPWFGLYMVANELKDSVLADSAMKHVKALSQDPAALGAHNEVAAATEKALGGPMPAAHPSSAAPNVDVTQPLPPGHPSTMPAVPPGHPSRAQMPSGHPQVQPAPVTAPLPRKG